MKYYKIEQTQGDILSIDCETSKPIHWWPFSVNVSPLSPDPQPEKARTITGSI